MEITSKDLANFLQCDHIGGVVSVKWATTLDQPRDNRLAFCISPDNPGLAAWENIEAVLVGPENLKKPHSCAHLVSNNPRRDFGRLLERFFVDVPAPKISSTANIHPSASIGQRVSIGHYSVIEEHSVVGDDVVIGHNTTILARTVVGNNCVIGSNTVIGSIGFGLEKDEVGNWMRIPHIGRVVISDNVEIGSSTVIARGTIDATRIGKNCKIDDNVFLAHNVQVGDNTVIIANSEVSGSVQIGRDSWIAPAVTIIEGITIGENTLIGIGSVVIRDVPSNVVAVGNPAKVLRDR